MSTFPDQLYQYGGTPVNGFMTTGKTYFVKPSTGSNGSSGKSPSKAFATLAKAQSVASADKGDVVYMVAESNTAASTTDYQSAALDWAKDGVHLIGIGAGPFMGQRSRIAQLSTATNVDNLFTLSADNCYVANIEVYHGVADATSKIAMLVSGQRNRIERSQISGAGHATMDTADNPSLKITGSENYFYKNYIGLDTIIRATSAYEVDITSAARTVLDECMVNSYTSGSTFKALSITSIDRFVLLKNCILCAVQGITSSVAPTGAIATATLNGQVWMIGGGVFGYADVTTADNSAVLVLTHSGLAANVVDQGVAKGTDVA